MTTERSTHSKKRQWLRRFWRLLSASALLVAAIVVWQSLDDMFPCTRIEIQGTSQASVAELTYLAYRDSLINAVLVADRIRRHPWVRWADASCSMLTRTIQVWVEERVPELLVLDRYGRAAYYVDDAGFRMPTHQGSTFDVPVLHNFSEPYHPVGPLQNREVRRLVTTLAGLDEKTDALISELTVTSQGMQMVTTSTPLSRPIEVWLGRDRYDEKLRHLVAFWEQVVLPQPQKKHFQQIDLRFDSLIVSRETDV